MNKKAFWIAFLMGMPLFVGGISRGAVPADILDGRLLLEGSANWSPSGEGAFCLRKYCELNDQQDNTVIRVGKR